MHLHKMCYFVEFQVKFSVSFIYIFLNFKLLDVLSVMKLNYEMVGPRFSFFGRHITVKCSTTFDKLSDGN